MRTLPSHRTRGLSTLVPSSNLQVAVFKKARLMDDHCSLIIASPWCQATRTFLQPRLKGALAPSGTTDERVPNSDSASKATMTFSLSAAMRPEI